PFVSAELTAGIVSVPSARRVWTPASEVPVHDGQAYRLVPDAVVAVHEVLAQAVGAELGVARMLDAELHRVLLRWISSRTGSRCILKRAGFSIIGKCPRPGMVVATAPGMRAAVAALFSARQE